MHRHPVTRLMTKVVVTLVGLGVLAAGLVMMVTPGPGVVAIVAGLAILATEFAWAERSLHHMRERVRAAAEKARAVDPAVRRRRLLLTVLVVVVLGGGLTAYVATRGWPDPAVSAWDWVQGLGSFVPELPGM